MNQSTSIVKQIRISVLTAVFALCAVIYSPSFSQSKGFEEISKAFIPHKTEKQNL